MQFLYTFLIGLLLVHWSSSQNPNRPNEACPEGQVWGCRRPCRPSRCEDVEAARTRTPSQWWTQCLNAKCVEGCYCPGRQLSKTAVDGSITCVQNVKKCCDISTQVYSECASACDRTCADPNPICTLQCVKRCTCPSWRPLLHEGECIKENKCPRTPPACTDGDMYCNECNKCTCQNGLFFCTLIGCLDPTAPGNGGCWVRRDGRCKFFNPCPDDAVTDANAFCQNNPAGTKFCQSGINVGCNNCECDASSVPVCNLQFCTPEKSDGEYKLIDGKCVFVIENDDVIDDVLPG